MHFTSILAGDSPPNTYTAAIASGAVLSSPAAEVAYFLDQSSTGSTGSVPLYRLIRRQRLVAMTANEAGNFTGVAAADQGIVAQSTAPTPAVYTLAKMTDPANRLGGTNFSRAASGTDANLYAMNNNGHVGDDVLLSNVVSFVVLANWEGGPQQPRAFFNTASGTITNSDFPFDYVSQCSGTGSEYIFDTGTSAPGSPSWTTVLPNGQPPLPQPQASAPGGYPAGKVIRLKSLQIRHAHLRPAAEVGPAGHHRPGHVSAAGVGESPTATARQTRDSFIHRGLNPCTVRHLSPRPHSAAAPS